MENLRISTMTAISSINSDINFKNKEKEIKNYSEKFLSEVINDLEKSADSSSA